MYLQRVSTHGNQLTLTGENMEPIAWTAAFAWFAFYVYRLGKQTGSRGGFRAGLRRRRQATRK